MSFYEKESRSPLTAESADDQVLRQLANMAFIALPGATITLPSGITLCNTELQLFASLFSDEAAESQD